MLDQLNTVTFRFEVILLFCRGKGSCTSWWISTFFGIRVLTEGNGHISKIYFAWLQIKQRKSVFHCKKPSFIIMVTFFRKNYQLFWFSRITSFITRHEIKIENTISIDRQNIWERKLICRVISNSIKIFWDPQPNSTKIRFLLLSCNSFDK